MKYFSLFSGVGGFELAINNVYDNLRPIQQEDNQRPEKQYESKNKSQQWECVGYSEIDRYAVSVYQYHYPKHKNYGDISKIDWKTVPDFDLVVGGSPCQDLSVAGKQKGLSGERSGLFFEFVRCLKEKQPTNFIWENVKGALSSSSGWDFARVQIEFSEAGYDVEWQVLNAKDFGVPQNRERIFVVGHLRGKSGPKVFPIYTTNAATTYNRTIRTGGKGSQDEKHRWDIVQVNQPTHSNDRVYSDDGISPSLNTMQGGRRQPKIEMKIANAVTPDAYLTRGERKRIDGKAVLTSMHERRIRRLTPRECEALMSWPIDWTKIGTIGEISDTQRYKMCGNGVVSRVVETIVGNIFGVS